MLLNPREYQGRDCPSSGRPNIVALMTFEDKSHLNSLQIVPIIPAPILRSIPFFVVGIPIVRAKRWRAEVSPTARFHENVSPGANFMLPPFLDLRLLPVAIQFPPRGDLRVRQQAFGALSRGHPVSSSPVPLVAASSESA